MYGLSKPDILEIYVPLGTIDCTHTYVTVKAILYCKKLWVAWAKIAGPSATTAYLRVRHF